MLRPLAAHRCLSRSGALQALSFALLQCANALLRPACPADCTRGGPLSRLPDHDDQCWRAARHLRALTGIHDQPVWGDHPLCVGAVRCVRCKRCVGVAGAASRGALAKVAFGVLARVAFGALARVAFGALARVAWGSRTGAACRRASFTHTLSFNMCRQCHALLPSHPATGYLTLPEVFGYGLLMGLLNLVLWGTVGSMWWRFLGFL